MSSATIKFDTEIGRHRYHIEMHIDDEDLDFPYRIVRALTPTLDDRRKPGMFEEYKKWEWRGWKDDILAGVTLPQAKERIAAFEAGKPNPFTQEKDSAADALLLKSHIAALERYLGIASATQATENDQ